MDTRNDGLEKVTPFKQWQFLIVFGIYVRFLGCSELGQLEQNWTHFSIGKNGQLTSSFLCAEGFPD